VTSFRNNHVIFGKGEEEEEKQERKIYVGKIVDGKEEAVVIEVGGRAATRPSTLPPIHTTGPTG
jgi:hypothetical protein